jgi:hypothetical protein
MFQIVTRSGFLTIATIALLSSFSLELNGSANAATPIGKPSVAQGIHSTTPRKRRRLFVPPTAPNTGRIGKSRGTATRGGNCPTVDTPLTALVPVYTTETGAELPMGLTTSDYPTLWFYVPYDLTPDRPARLVLETPEPGTQYMMQQTVLEITHLKAGIVGIPIPKNQAPLQVGQRAHWTLTILCNPKDAAANKYADLSLQRVALDPRLQQQLATATPQERVELYGSAGLWENTLTALAQLRRAAPGDRPLTIDWQDLLQAANLPELAGKPVSNLGRAD